MLIIQYARRLEAPDVNESLPFYILFLTYLFNIFDQNVYIYVAN